MPEIALTGASNPPIHSSVCRSIDFGECRRKRDVDGFLSKEFESLRKKDTARWNFDFYNGKPLKGQYEWRRVTRSQRNLSKNCLFNDDQ